MLNKKVKNKKEKDLYFDINFAMVGSFKSGVEYKCQSQTSEKLTFISEGTTCHETIYISVEEFEKIKDGLHIQ